MLCHVQEAGPKRLTDLGRTRPEKKRGLRRVVAGIGASLLRIDGNAARKKTPGTFSGLRLPLAVLPRNRTLALVMQRGYRERRLKCRLLLGEFPRAGKSPD